MITIICGTNRPGSNTRKVANHVVRIYQQLSVTHQLLDLAELPMEIFNPVSYGNKPAAFARFSDGILAADGLVVVTPEYNGGVPGVLKYFIDMLKFPESFQDRPVCFVGLSAGRWGALRPIEQLQQIFGYRNAYIHPQRVFLPEISGLLDEKGEIQDTELAARLKEQAEGFVGFVERLRGKKLR
jgi:chromate reductase